MVNIDAVEKGVAKYFDEELINKLPENGFQRVIAATVMSMSIKKSGVIVESFKDHPFVKMLEIFDEAGNIDIDTLKEEFKKQMPQTGVKIDVPMIGTLTFMGEDIDKLYSCITSYSSKEV